MTKSNDILRYAFERGYRVTADGDVVSPRGNIRKTSTKSDGYKRFTVADRKGSSFPIGVHRLAAIQKFGDAALESGIHTRHLDGDPGNNHLDNIEIGTQSQNMMDRDPEVRRQHALKATHSRDSIRLSPELVAELRERRQQGATVNELAREVGVAKSTMSVALRGLTWKQ